MRTLRPALALLVPLLLAAPSPAASGSKYLPKGSPVPYEGTFATLPSGLRVVVYEMAHVDRFAVTVSYGAGGAQDPAGKEGLAHLAEHLAYRSRLPWVGRARLFDALVASGLRFNGSTSHDATDYYAVGKPGDLRVALAIEAARMRDPLAGLTEDDFAVERDVVISEYRERYETDPRGAEVQAVLEAAFPGHPYGRRVAGTPRSLETISLEDVRAWLRTRYVPANAVVVVIAPGKARDVAALVAATFDELAVPAEGASVAPSDPAPLPAPALPPASRTVRHPAPVRQPIVWVAWSVPGGRAQRDAQGHAAAVALDAAFAGAAVRSLRMGANDAIETWDTAYLAFADAGLVVLRVEVANEKYADRVVEMARTAALGLRLDESDHHQDTAFTRRERLNAIVATRDRLLVDAYVDLEQIDGRSVARFLRATGKPDRLAGWTDQVVRQLNVDVAPYLAEFLRRERSAAVVIVPDQNPLARVAAGGEPSVAEDDLADEGDWVPPEAARARAVARAPGLDRAERRVLPNGLRVVVTRRGSLPVADLRLLVRTSVEGGAGVTAGLPTLALGTNYARFAARELGLVGGAAWIGLEGEHLVRAVRGASGNLDVLLGATAEWARDQKARWFDGARELYLRRVARLEHDPDELGVRALHANLFPRHPYGAAPERAGIAKVSAGDADRWLKQEIRPERATLVVTSDQPPSPELWAAIEGHFGGWRRGGADRVGAPAAALPPGRTVVLVHRAGATQALVATGVRAPTLAARDVSATDAVRWLARSRLQQRLRVEEGVSYGVAASVVEHEQAAALVFAAAVEPDAAARSLKALLDAPARIAAEPPAAASAGRARWQVARAFAFAFDTVGEAADALVTQARFDLPPDHWERQPEAIGALTSERIQAAAAALAVGKESVVVIGDAAVLEPQLRAAGFVPEVIRPGAGGS